MEYTIKPERITGNSSYGSLSEMIIKEAKENNMSIANLLYVFNSVLWELTNTMKVPTESI